MKLEKLLVIAIVALFATETWAQSKYWAMPSRQVEMSTSPTLSSLPNATGNSYSFSNGAYDENGNLLFYLRNREVYDQNGAYVDDLPVVYTNGCSPGKEDLDQLSYGPCIVPIPGECKRYYVIYAMQGFTYSQLSYVIIDASSSSLNITTNVTSCFPSSEQPFFIDISLGDNSSFLLGFAVANIKSGVGSTAERYLYIVSDEGIFKSTISASGFSSTTLVVSPSTLNLDSYLDFRPFEVELSEDNSYLAWSNPSSVHIIKIDPNTGTYVNGSLISPNVGFTAGIEFRSSISDPRLLISTSTGIKNFRISNQTITSISTPGYDLTNTFLERGSNNVIYGMSPIAGGEGELVGITTSGSITSPIAVNVDSRMTGNFLSGSEIYTLPNFIDFETNDPLSISGLIIGTEYQPLTTDCAGTHFNFCQENPLPLTSLTGGNFTSYRLELFSANARGCQPSTNLQDLNYDSQWVQSNTPNYLDLRILTDPEGQSLDNITGVIGIRLSIRNDCGNIVTYLAYFQVNNCPGIADNSSPNNQLAHTFSEINTIYPNPATDEINLHLDIGKEEYFTISIIDVVGREFVLSERVRIFEGQQTIRIPLGSLPSGFYQLNLRSTSETLTESLIIQQH